MLEKPDLPDSSIAACLEAAYEVRGAHVTFLPLGADRNTAVYRVRARVLAHNGAGDRPTYFLKLRRGDFDEIAVTVPAFLSDQGIGQIIAPLATRTGQLWAELDAFKAILYPFVAGRNGYEVELSDRHWVALGAALKRIHTAPLPPALARRIPHETYSPRWRDVVVTFLARVETEAFADPVAARLAALLRAKRAVISDLVGRAERLAQALQARPRDDVLCHSDVHAGNALIADDTALLYIVDWDNPILAPKERDLMFAGGGQFGAGRTPQQEEALFYQGYGQTAVDPAALAYYRYERIVEDIAVFCEQIFLTNEGGEDREQSLRYLAANFLPQGTIAIAYRADETREIVCLPGGGVLESRQPG